MTPKKEFLPSCPHAALLTDLYELTMLQAYWANSMHDDAVFSLFVRKLPKQRNF
jgi:nicotinate phosphoribosyltransferase